MSARIPTAQGPVRHLACRYRTMLSSHTIPTATTRFSDDDMLLFLLMSTWELHTARPAPTRLLTNMPEEELIEYWSNPADDPCPPGCPAPHPGPANPDHPAADPGTEPSA